MSLSEKRSTGIRMAKGLCMLGLPLVHTVEMISGTGMMNTDGFNPELLIIISIIGPAVFCICMGYNLDKRQSPHKLMVSGIRIFIIGFLLSVVRFAIPIILAMLLIEGSYDVTTIGITVLTSDIYYFVGMFYMLMALFRKLRLSDKSILIISVAMVAVNTFFTSRYHLDDSSIIAGLIGNVVHVNDESYFPLMGWFIFPVMGMMLAKHNNCTSMKAAELAESIALCLAGLAAVYASLSYFEIDTYTLMSYPTNGYAIEIISIAIQIMLAVIIINGLQLAVKLTRKNPVESFLDRMSFYLVPFYMIQWVIVSWINMLFLMFFYGQRVFTLLPILLAALVTTVVSLILSVRYGTKLMKWLFKITAFVR